MITKLVQTHDARLEDLDSNYDHQIPTLTTPWFYWKNIANTQPNIHQDYIDENRS